MRDFLNREIKPGHWICFSGAGNVKAEYGMQIALVTKVNDTSIRIKRLDATYQKGIPSIEVYEASMTNTRQCSILENFGSETLWEIVARAISNGPLEDSEKEFLASWIHGKYPKWELINYEVDNDKS